MASIYIDPTAGVDGSGSIGSPRNIFPTITANNDYYVKRETRLLQTAVIAISTGDDNVTINAYGEGYDPIIDAQNTHASNFTISGCSNVTINDMVCVNATQTSSVVSITGTTDNAVLNRMTIYGVNQAVIVSGAGVTNCVVQNCTLYSPDMNNQCLEFNTNGAGCEALNNRIIFTGSDRNQTSCFGIYTLLGSPVLIDGNTVTGFYNGIETRVNSTIIRNNSVTDSYNAGISIRDADTCIVEDNTLTDIWNDLQYDGGAGAGSGGGLGAGVNILDISDAALNNVVRRNKIIDCYQGILDQSDFGGGNSYYDNLITGHRVNGISYQSDGAIGKIWNNTIIHHPQDTVNPTGHGIVVQSGTANTRASIRNNIIICDLLGSNIQCLSLGGTPGTNYTEIELQNNIYVTENDAHMCAISAVNYDTMSDWQTAISGVTQVTVKDTKSQTNSPIFKDGYIPAAIYTLELGDVPLGTTDVYGTTRRSPGTLGAVEAPYNVRPCPYNRILVQ